LRDSEVVENDEAEGSSISAERRIAAVKRLDMSVFCKRLQTVCDRAS
jgi:hypothetical protein